MCVYCVVKVAGYPVQVNAQLQDYNHLAPLYVCLPILSQECLLYTILVIHCHQNLSAACSIDLMSL